MNEPGRPCRVALIGMMGSGKSTMGRIIARQTSWPYLDNDILLEQSIGVTARNLLATAGEADLRRAEADALLFGLRQPEPAIIGAGAGTILDPECRAALESNALVVWLRASPETLAARARGAAHRPWLETDAVRWMRNTLDQRTPLYESVTDLAVDTEGRTAVESAAEIVDWLDTVSSCADLLSGSAQEHD